MENHKNIIPQEPQSVSMFAYELYRDILLPEIFGKDTADIFYWAGKQLARKFPLLSIDEICSFFEEACWGTLQVIKEEKKELLFELSGPIVLRKFDIYSEPFFSLEAGFLAEQIQTQKNVTAEAIEEVHKRSKKVRLLVKWE
ncbi:YslB family protein [Bacillus smithii]|uniref:YslB family protein n=1 Tax=Bacillus smithii TaxID=1479 RepID=UPI0030C90658